MTPEERVARAEEARRITENKVFQEAKDEMLSAIRGLRLQVSPRDVDGSHKLVLMEQTVERTHQFLTAFMYDGEVAKKQLEEEGRPEDDSALGKVIRKFRQVV